MMFAKAPHRPQKPSMWICICRRKNDATDLKCVFCGTDQPERKTQPKVGFMGANVPNVQRGTYSCSKGEVYFRSKWEANWALYLDFMVKTRIIKDWEYEPMTFVFDQVSFGIRRYIPDFQVHMHDGDVIYHEVKGYMDSASKTKLKRMAKYYPEVKLELIDQKRYDGVLKSLKGIVKFHT